MEVISSGLCRAAGGAGCRAVSSGGCEAVAGGLQRRGVKSFQLIRILVVWLLIH